MGGDKAIRIIIGGALLNRITALIKRLQRAPSPLL